MTVGGDGHIRAPLFFFLFIIRACAVQHCVCVSARARVYTHSSSSSFASYSSSSCAFTAAVAADALREPVLHDEDIIQPQQLCVLTQPVQLLTRHLINSA